ncbi:hypothetical protein C8R47DRAFT_1109063 [Mycena vitilis]|nr:hypothetical protein C8R47DRAFT_1109063 [Mycena vitilis]
MRAARESTRNEKLGTFAPGDLVLAKIKGSPLWPAIVADPSTASEAQTKQRPRVRKNAVYYIRFLGVKAGTHAWLTAYKLAPLGRTEIQARIRERARKKNTNLTKGYRKVRDWLLPSVDEASIGECGSRDVMKDWLSHTLR